MLSYARKTELTLQRRQQVSWTALEQVATVKSLTDTIRIPWKSVYKTVAKCRCFSSDKKLVLTDCGRSKNCKEKLHLPTPSQHGEFMSDHWSDLLVDQLATHLPRTVSGGWRARAVQLRPPRPQTDSRLLVPVSVIWGFRQ